MLTSRVLGSPRLENVDDYVATVRKDKPTMAGVATQIAVILMASADRGTNADHLARWSGFKRTFVRDLAKKLRARGTWKKNGEVGVSRSLDPHGFWSEVQALYGRPILVTKDKPYSLDELRALHREVNQYQRDSYAGFGRVFENRRLTLAEWRRIDAAIKEHQLAVVMRTSSYGFKLGVDIIDPPLYPHLPPTPIMAITQDALPLKLATKSRFQQGDKEWNPREEWNSTWDLFGQWVWTDENMSRVRFCGINMPTRKTAYEY